MIDVAECKASLWLTGDTLDPDKFARLLGRTPAYCIRRGDTYQSKTGEEMVASTGRFQLTTGWRTGEPLERLVRELLDQVPTTLPCGRRSTPPYQAKSLAASFWTA